MTLESRQLRRRSARSRRRIRSALFVAVVAVLGTGAGATASRPSGGGATPGPAAEAGRPAAGRPVAGRRIAQERPVEPALAVVAAMPPAPPPPPEHVPPLPEPDPLPDPGARVPLVAVGRIRIPKIGLDQTVREGVEQMVIDAGPAHWPGTAAFGGWGTTVLAGHRSTHSEPFRRVAELVAGDQIALADLVGTYTYRVTGTEVVANTALWVVDQQPGRHLMIFTCHPIGSSAQRFVVRAELVSTPRPEQ